MGHTIPAKRRIIYKKLDELKRFADSSREPYRSRFIDLINSVYPHISSIIYTNSLDDDEMIIYAMLLDYSYHKFVNIDNKLLKCLSILLK